MRHDKTWLISGICCRISKGNSWARMPSSHARRGIMLPLPWTCNSFVWWCTANWDWCAATIRAGHMISASAMHLSAFLITNTKVDFPSSGNFSKHPSCLMGDFAIIQQICPSRCCMSPHSPVAVYRNETAIDIVMSYLMLMIRLVQIPVPAFDDQQSPSQRII